LGSKSAQSLTCKVVEVRQQPDRDAKQGGKQQAGEVAALVGEEVDIHDEVGPAMVN
jgi:hypothetical protein